jgi:GNAT superfamily N-acetyltransferase
MIATTNKASNPKTECQVRRATAADAKVIVSLIHDLAVYEKLADQVVVTEEIVIRNLFGAHPYAECLIAEIDQSPVGFAVFFYTFSTFLGKPGIYLEDLYVLPEHRGCGAGMKLLRELGRTARARDCGRIEWAVLNWNEPAINFYCKLGAKPQDEWTVYRLTRAEIEQLAES